MLFSTFAQPLNSKTGSNIFGVPGIFDLALAGHPYIADTSFEPYRRDSYRSQSLTPVADRTDISNIPGEASINTAQLFRREMQDWSSGAGQEFLDRRSSMDNRFKSSKGIYPWLPWSVQLLNDTTQILADENIQQVVVCNQGVDGYGDVYILTQDADTNTIIQYSHNGDFGTWTTVTGMPDNTVNNYLNMTTDDTNVYVTISGDDAGIYKITSGAGTSYVTGGVTQVWYVGGILLAANAYNLYQITESGSLSSDGSAPNPLITYGETLPFGNFHFVSAAAGNSYVYIGGTSRTGLAGGVNIIYRTQMNSTGTQLDPPVVAATFPSGETIYSLYSYANYIMVGTALGARYCVTLGLNDPGGNQGDLKLGPLIPDLIQQVTKPIKCFVGQGRFIWFGWSNYDASSTGLGRMDLSTFIDVQAPAYTSDLMVDGTGEIISMDWWDKGDAIQGIMEGCPIFVVQGVGLYLATTTYVDSGEIQTGYMEYGFPDDKIALYADWHASGSGGSVGGSLMVDDGLASYVFPTQSLTDQLTQAPVPQIRGQRFSPTITLISDETNTLTPILKRFILKSLPAVVAPTMHMVAIDLTETMATRGVNVYNNPYTEWKYLDGLRQASTPVLYVEGSELAISVVIFSIDRLIYKRRGVSEGGGFQQTLVLSLKSLEN